MGLLDGLIGGAVGAEMVSVVNGFIQKQGGVRGVVNQFEKQGLGSTVRSWVSGSENHPITADQVHRVVGYEKLQELGAKLGISPDEMAAKLSELLPKAIDKMTPRGTVQ